MTTAILVSSACSDGYSIKGVHLALPVDIDYNA